MHAAPVPRAKLLLFVCPTSGSGISTELVQQYVLPLLQAANLNYEMIVSERAGHIQDFLASAELADVGGVVVAGGDGSVNEAVNGILSRDDRHEVLSIPLTVLPHGSDNALARALGTRQTLDAVLALIQGVCVAIDVISCTDDTGALRYLLCGVCLLYTSDAADEEDSVDIGGFRNIKKKNYIIQIISC
eukprot:TRINITY_DN10535_c0_g2_i1.p1 TRINITY_DN10535_c0_g2~~TRINITY_DN10535_c0_g2_i1.p1  ORF type:complete len:189 (-),score=28.58 TRINITY_DN10535_c0_g2_i1:45-611(-)